MGCEEGGVSSDYMLKLNDDLWNYLQKPLELIIDVCILLGIVIIFIVFRDRKKPGFVKVIWFLLLLCALCNILYVISRSQSYKIDNQGTLKFLHNLSKVTIVIV